MVGLRPGPPKGSSRKLQASTRASELEAQDHEWTGWSHVGQWGEGQGKKARRGIQGWPPRRGTRVIVSPALTALQSSPALGPTVSETADRGLD